MGVAYSRPASNYFPRMISGEMIAVLTLRARSRSHSTLKPTLVDLRSTSYSPLLFLIL
jgi:hypothetical protein